MTVQTLCWNCNAQYGMAANQCPACGATNAKELVRAIKTGQRFEIDMSAEPQERIEKLERELSRITKSRDQFVSDFCETEDYIRAEARKVLDHAYIDGDSYDFPTIEELVQNIVAELLLAREQLAECKDALDDAATRMHGGTT